MDEFSEDLTPTPLPDWAASYFASERVWWRMLRGTGLMSPEEAAEALSRWMGR
ncbi:hypothetical protein [Mycolicibacterium mageritense]|uniref:hypothetical protein n=1 Tax=Mycolicibacterium mageritense TaxID=53462 RepID=UPI0023F26D46|nr:hypothetical protein [Mycolicibacterium mageritense]